MSRLTGFFFKTRKDDSHPCEVDNTPRQEDLLHDPSPLIER